MIVRQNFCNTYNRASLGVARIGNGISDLFHRDMTFHALSQASLNLIYRCPETWMRDIALKHKLKYLGIYAKVLWIFF